MLKHPSIILFSLLLLGGGFFGVAGAQGYDTTFNAAVASPAMKDIYRVDQVRSELPFITQNVHRILLAKADVGHAAPDQYPSQDSSQDIVYELDHNKIASLLQESSGFDEFFHNVRMDILNFLVETGYTGFDTMPYQSDGNFAITVQSGDFKVLKSISETDGLDMFLKNVLSGFKDSFIDIKQYGNYLDFKNITISPQDYAQLGHVFMFKNEQDLRDLGYELISRRSRIDKDQGYRRVNIQAAFHNIGNVRLIMPGETFSAYQELNGNPGDGGEHFVAGYAIVGGGINKVYGGGLCGVSTAMYQGMLTNLGLQVVEYRAHSIYYRTYYVANINGILAYQPGLDATLYLGNPDMQVKNIRAYPIVAVFNYDGSYGGAEDMFTLSKAQDRGTFEYVGSPSKNCYTRNINGEDRTNCYTKIEN